MNNLGQLSIELTELKSTLESGMPYLEIEKHAELNAQAI